jgi:hypothetical protein
VSGIATYEDIKSGNVTESTFDVIGDLVSLGSLGTEVKARPEFWLLYLSQMFMGTAC